MSLYEAIWEKGLEPQLIAFCDGLDWTYIIILTTCFYGITHTQLLDWFINLCHKFHTKKYTMWYAALITLVIFLIFKGFEKSITLDYIGAILQSMFFTVIFSSIFVDIPVYLIKGLGKFIDDKAANSNKKE